MRSWSQPTESTYRLECSCEIDRLRAWQFFNRGMRSSSIPGKCSVVSLKLATVVTTASPPVVDLSLANVIAVLDLLSASARETEARVQHLQQRFGPASPPRESLGIRCCSGSRIEGKDGSFHWCGKRTRPRRDERHAPHAGSLPPGCAH